MGAVLGAPGLHRPTVPEEESFASTVPTETKDLNGDLVFSGAGSTDTESALLFLGVFLAYSKASLS